jgi:acyl carrier protein
MNNNGINETIRSYIADNILYSNKGFPYSDDTSFLENGIIDSMNIMEIVMFVEDKFAISVADEDITPENFDSVTRLAAFIHRKKTPIAKSAAIA